MGVPISIRGKLWGVKVATPIVGELGGLIPRVNPTVSTSTNVADDPIEVELRLHVAMVTKTARFKIEDFTDLA